MARLDLQYCRDNRRLTSSESTLLDLQAIVQGSARANGTRVTSLAALASPTPTILIALQSSASRVRSRSSHKPSRGQCNDPWTSAPPDSAERSAPSRGGRWQPV